MISLAAELTKGVIQADQNYRREKERLEDKALALSEHKEDREFLREQRKTSQKIDAMNLRDRELAQFERAANMEAEMDDYLDDFNPFQDEEGGVIPTIQRTMAEHQRIMDSMVLPGDPTKPSQDGKAVQQQASGGYPTLPVPSAGIQRGPGGFGTGGQRLASVSTSGPVGMGGFRHGRESQVRQSGQQPGKISEFGGLNTQDTQRPAGAYYGFGMEQLQREMIHQQQGYDSTRGRARKALDELVNSERFKAMPIDEQMDAKAKVWMRFRPGVQKASAQLQQTVAKLRQAGEAYQIGGALQAMNAMDFSSPEKLAASIQEASVRFPQADWSLLKEVRYTKEHGEVVLVDGAGTKWNPLVLKMMAAGAISFPDAIKEQDSWRKFLLDARKADQEDEKLKDNRLHNRQSLALGYARLNQEKSERKPTETEELDARFREYNEIVAEMQKIENGRGFGDKDVQGNTRWQQLNNRKGQVHNLIDGLRTKADRIQMQGERQDFEIRKRATEAAFGPVFRLVSDIQRKVGRERTPIEDSDIQGIRDAIRESLYAAKGSGATQQTIEATKQSIMGTLALHLSQEQQQQIRNALDVGAAVANIQGGDEVTSAVHAAR